MNRIGVDKGVGKLVSTGLADVPGTPRLFMKHRATAERAAIGQQAGKNFVNTVADHPEVVPIAAAPFGSVLAPAYLKAKKKLFGGPTKLANGDMLQYFLDHPQKRREYEARQKAKLEKTAQVLPYQQRQQWSCSAGCFKAVLGHFGIPIDEDLAIQVIGTKPGRGAEVDEIAAGARKLGLDAFDYSFDSLEQAQVVLEQDIPIICDIQSFNHPGKGHYIVLVKLQDGRALIMDPNTPGNMRVLTEAELNARWWDRTMAPPHNIVPKWGVVILPPEESA